MIRVIGQFFAALFFILSTLRGYIPSADMLLAALMFISGVAICLAGSLGQRRLIFAFFLISPIIFLSAIIGIYSGQFIVDTTTSFVLIFENIYYIPLAIALFSNILSFQWLSALNVIVLVSLVFSGVLQLSGFPVPILIDVAIHSSYETLTRSRLVGFAGTSTPYAYMLSFSALTFLLLNAKRSSAILVSAYRKLLLFVSIILIVLSFSRAPTIYFFLWTFFLPVMETFVVFEKKFAIRLPSLNTKSFLSMALVSLVFVLISYNFISVYLERTFSAFSGLDTGNQLRDYYRDVLISRCSSGAFDWFFGIGLGSTSRFLSRLSGESQIIKYTCEFGSLATSGFLSILFYKLIKHFQSISLAAASSLLFLLPLWYLQLFVNPAMSGYYLMFVYVAYSHLFEVSNSCREPGVI